MTGENDMLRREYPSLSVIVPAYNAADTIRECLRALHASTLKPLEIIVVDDASEDATSVIAGKHQVRLLRLENNRGAGAARNVAQRLARGELLLFVDADICVSCGSTRLVADYLSSHPEVAAVTGLLSRRHPHRNFFSLYKNLYMNAIFSRPEVEVDFLYGGIFAVKRGKYLQMTEERVLGEDIELGRRMRRKGLTIHLLKELEVVHRKKYTFRSLIRNDFRVPFFLARMFWSQRAYPSMFRDRRFSHTSGRQIIATAISPLLPLGLGLIFFHRLSWVFTALTFACFFYLNRDILQLYRREQGLRFAVTGALFFCFDAVVMMSGLICGSLSFFTSRLLRLRQN
jgi:glycosyltransferase involved in cell wall biosynthesis